MDFPVKGKADDYSFKYDIMDSKSEKYPSGDMSDDWAPPDDIFSLFPIDNDFLNNFGQTREFDSLDDLSAHLKMEVGDYELNSSNEFENDPITYEEYENVTVEEKNISSSSSDSGLSSDNLDMDMSPIFEPLSPAISSPGPSISERGAKNSPPRNEISFIEHQTVHKYPEKPVETRPKVIIQKIPQILTLPTKHIETSKGSLAGGKEIKIVKLPQQIFSAANNKKVTIQVKNSNTGARIQANPGTFFINNGKITEVKKLVRLQNAVNPRSVLLPVSMQDVKDLKNFKIVKAPITALKSDTTKISKVLPQEVKTLGKAKPFKLQDDSLSDQTSDGESYVYDDGNSYEYDSELKCFLDKGSETETPYPKLMLTAEEKRLLAKEGITLPTHYPLTKHEERELKRIRRKIRNKISAQDSRKRKREYVDGLEERVKQCTEENQTLLKRIKLLQNQNQNLVTQMKKLQTLLSKGTNKTAHPTTCLMVLLLSLALVAAPNLKLGQNIKEGELEEVMQDTVLQNRRNLLFDVKEQNLDIFDEDIDMAELVDMSETSIAQREFGQCFDNKRKFAQNNNEPLCKKPKFIDFDVDDQNWYHVKEMEKIKNLDSSDKLADKSQDDKKVAQTSGFNINPQLTDTNLFDQDVMELLTQKSNNLYDFTLDKLSGAQNDGPIIDFAAKHVYAEETDKKLNLSELRNYQKY